MTRDGHDRRRCHRERRLVLLVGVRRGVEVELVIGQTELAGARREHEVRGKAGQARATGRQAAEVVARRVLLTQQVDAGPERVHVGHDGIGVDASIARVEYAGDASTRSEDAAHAAPKIDPSPGLLDDLDEGVGERLRAAARVVGAVAQRGPQVVREREIREPRRRQPEEERELAKRELCARAREVPVEHAAERHVGRVGRRREAHEFEHTREAAREQRGLFHVFQDGGQAGEKRPEPFALVGKCATQRRERFLKAGRHAHVETRADAAIDVGQGQKLDPFGDAKLAQEVVERSPPLWRADPRQ